MRDLRFELAPSRSSPAARPLPAPTETPRFRVTALVAAYNEEDVIGQVIGDLIAHGIEVYLLDHCSTDATVEEASRHLGKGLLRIERFPDESGFPRGEASRYAWRSILRRKEQLARELESSWFLHHDADELREGPWDGVSLKESIRRVDVLGFNAIDFRAVDFVPIRDGFRRGDDLRDAFRYWRPAAAYDKLRINCWKKGDTPVALAESGGHEVVFPDRRIFPVRFLLRHYPIRSQGHGEQKVFRDRLPRFAPDERAIGWHVQYDHVRPGGSFIASADELTLFDGARVRAELLIENRDLETAREKLAQAEHRAARLENELAAVASDVAWFRQEWPRREAELVELAATLEATREECRRRESALAEMATSLEMARNDWRHREAQLVEVAQESARRTEEASREALVRLDVIAALQRQVDDLLNSKIWRWTAPLRFVMEFLRGR